MRVRERATTLLLDTGAIVAAASTGIGGLLRGRRGRVRDHLRRRALAPIPQRAGNRPCLWLHGVSVGEVLAGRGLVKEFAAAHRDWDVVVSVSTKLGLEAARSAYPELLVVSFPLDLSARVQRAFERLHPSLIAIVEHDLWPNFLRAASARGVPVALINARLSEHSGRRYRALSRFLSWPPGPLAMICAQDESSARRFAALGFPSERIAVTGNLKFDNPPPAAGRVRESNGFTDSDWILVAGSTHAGEEEAALAALRAAREADERSFLILAPRRTERVDEIARLIEERGFSWELWSSDTRRRRDVLLVDTIGELARIWAAGNVVFVGGTLVPVGGHNVIEPASLGRPVVIGPYYDKARSVVEVFHHRGAIVIADGPEDLVGRIAALRAEPQRARDIGARARRTVEENLGATDRTLDALAGIATRHTGTGNSV